MDSTSWHDKYDGQMNKLTHLKQTSSIADYRTQFEECVYHFLSLDPYLGPPWFVIQFLFGLGMIFVAPCDCKGRRRSRMRNLSISGLPHTHQSLPNTDMCCGSGDRAPRRMNILASFPRQWRLQLGLQLWHFRCSNNMCFKCGDKYSMGAPM